MIQCASEVVYEISEDDGNQRIRLLGDSEPVSDALRLSLWLPDLDDLVRVAVGVPLGLTADIYHVVLRPLELEPPGIWHDIYSVRLRLGYLVD